MKTERVLTGLRVVVWIAFIGAIIRAVMVAIGLVSIFFEKSDQPDVPALTPFLLVTSLSLAIMIFYVQLWLKVKDLLTVINLSNPFTIEIAHILVAISRVLLSIWIVSFIGKNYSHYLRKHMPEVGSVVQAIDSDLTGFDASGVYLLTAGIVYIIAQVFKRGVELQQENELTI